MQCPDLPKPRQGDFDGWPEVALPHRFDQVGQDAGVLGFVHELAIGVGDEDPQRVRHYSRALDAIRGTVITARVPAVPGAACCPAPPEKTSVPPRSSVTRARTIFNPRSVPAVGSNR